MHVAEEKKDDLSIDFRKLFKRAKPHAPEHAAESAAEPAGDAASLDLRALWPFLKKAYPVLLVLIPFLLAGYLRVVWLDLPQVEHWAENSVENFYRNQISSQISAQYPNLPPQNKQALVDRELGKFKAERADQRAQQIQQTAEQLKDHFREDGSKATYIGDIDTYYFLKRTENLVRYGHVGNRLVNGTSYDDYTLAPVGEFVDSSMIYYAVAWTYKILHAINRNVTLRFAFVYVPVLLAMLSVIPAFFLARRIGGNFGGFFAAMLVAVHGNYLNRTLGGSTDTDVYNVFFPLLIFWLFVESFERTRRAQKILSAVLAGFAVGLYSFAWGGWWYIFDFILFTAIAYFLFHALLAWRKRQSLREAMANVRLREFGIALCSFLIVSAICVSLFSGWNTFTEAPLSPFQIFRLKQASQESLWPNVYTTVAELNEVGIGTIIGSLGGKFLVLLSLMGLVFAVAKREGKNLLLFAIALAYYLLLFSLQNTITNALLYIGLLGLPVVFGIALALIQRAEIDVTLALVFAMWYIGMIYASTKGVRFTMLIVPPFAIGLGLFAGYLAEHLGDWLNRELKVGKALGKGILIVLLSILLISPVRASFRSAEQGIPLINDAWWHVLEKIKETTPPHAFITSWWDYGHWFKYVADRPVTFDGANQNNPQAHWVGKFFLTWDEQEALGMLRMLDCSGMEGANYLNRYLNDTYATVTLLREILLLPMGKARDVLSTRLSADAVEPALAYTHCRPPPAVVISSEDMVGKSGVWAHFGAWDFAKAKAWITARGKPRAEAMPALIAALNLSESAAEALYAEIIALPDEGAANRWIAPWPGLSGGNMNCQREGNSTALCPISVQGKQVPLRIDLTTFTADIAGADVTYHPDSMAYTDGAKFNVRLYTNNTIGLSLALISDGASEVAVYMDPQHTGSMFTRLFYFNGAGTKYFQKISQERDITGLDIIAWKVDWDLYLNDLEGEGAVLPESPYKSNYPTWV